MRREDKLRSVWRVGGMRRIAVVGFIRREGVVSMTKTLEFGGTGSDVTLAAREKMYVFE